MELKFGLIGDGVIAQKHKYTIDSIGGDIIKIYDPIKYNRGGELYCNELNKYFFEDLDYVVICSPSFLHREHTKLSLYYDKRVIVEKPASLPWEPLIDDDRISVVLQFRWLDLPKKADFVKVTMVRDEKYFKSWKGDPKETGGLFYHLFIHYIDLALILGARFEGIVQPEGRQIRLIDDMDLMKVDMNELYVKMYSDIVNKNKGVKPRDIFYLHWLLNRNGEMHGLGLDAMNKKISIESRLGG